MRIIAFADTHQNTSLLRQSVRLAEEDGRIDVLIHCGDGVRDLEEIENELLRSNPHIRIYAVAGNCDLCASAYPTTEIAVLNGVRALITHGHNYQVKHGLGKLSREARNMNIQLVFFGHTHQAEVREKHGVTLINPGSLLSWKETDTAYLEIMVDENRQITVNFIKNRSK